jgi:hypothetical protein
MSFSGGYPVDLSGGGNSAALAAETAARIAADTAEATARANADSAHIAGAPTNPDPHGDRAYFPWTVSTHYVPVSGVAFTPGALIPAPKACTVCVHENGAVWAVTAGPTTGAENSLATVGFYDASYPISQPTYKMIITSANAISVTLLS